MWRLEAYYDETYGENPGWDFSSHEIDSEVQKDASFEVLLKHAAMIQQRYGQTLTYRLRNEETGDIIMADIL
jgi:hypothetical protein